MIKKLNIDTLRQLIAEFEKQEYSPSNYEISYPYFVDFFKNKKEITERDLIISANFVYGWMPTILKLNKNSKEYSIENLIKDSVKILNKIHYSNKALEKEDIETLMKLINNSVVGVSKLLHFINPEKYPIFDSKISKYLNVKINPKNYIDYVSKCNELITSSNYENIHKRYLEKTRQDKSKITKIRSLENLIFLSK